MSDSDARARKLRAALALTLVVGAYLGVRLSGLGDYLDVERLRALVAQAGPWGPIAFVAVFVGAVVSQIPGLVFVAAAPALFRLPQAWLLCFVASNLAVTLNFELVRRVGGQPLARIEKPWLQRLFGALDEHPIRTVALLRTLTVMFPPVTGALALTRISSREHALGSALGMVLPVTAILLAAGMLLR
jgi:uncharacterized membrane protein YdjX (TVP38/TMEM64 family)